MRLDLPKGRSLIGAINFGALHYGTSAIFFHWSLIEGSPRMFRIILALSPLITFLLAIVHQQENFHWRTLVGGLISLAGVGIVFHDGINAHVSVMSLTAIVLGAVSVSEAIVLYKSFPPQESSYYNDCNWYGCWCIDAFCGILTYWRSFHNTHPIIHLDGTCVFNHFWINFVFCSGFCCC